MFFRKMTAEEKANSDKAARTTFIFFLIALGGSSIYSYLKTAELNISFVILMSGLVVFFGSSYLYGKFDKK